MAAAITVGDAIHSFVQTRRNEGTRTQYRSRLAFLDRKLGHRDVRYLDHRAIFDYLYAQPGGELVKASKSRGDAHRTAIQGLLDYAHVMGWMPHHLSVPPSPYDEPAYVRNWTYLTGSQLVQAKEAATNSRLRVAIAVASNTALRVEDVLGVEVDRIYLDRGEMQVWIQKSKVWDWKPITADLAEELKPALEGHPGGYLIPGFTAEGFNKLGGAYKADHGRKASYTWAQLGLKRALDDAGIERGERECWHMIRRSVARRYFDRCMIQGYDHALRLTQAMLNHKNQATTERYLGLRREYEERNRSLRGMRFLAD